MKPVFEDNSSIAKPISPVFKSVSKRLSILSLGACDKGRGVRSPSRSGALRRRVFVRVSERALRPESSSSPPYMKGVCQGTELRTQERHRPVSGALDVRRTGSQDDPPVARMRQTARIRATIGADVYQPWTFCCPWLRVRWAGQHTCRSKVSRPTWVDYFEGLQAGIGRDLLTTKIQLVL